MLNFVHQDRVLLPCNDMETESSIVAEGAAIVCMKSNLSCTSKVCSCSIIPSNLTQVFLDREITALLFTFVLYSILGLSGYICWTI